MRFLLLLLPFACLGSAVLHAQEIPFADGHNAWNPDSLGNIRAVVHCPGPGAAAFVHIPWRRRDEKPELKRIIVEDGQTRQRVLHVEVVRVNREYGDLYFEPVSGAGTYYVYYMPYKNEGRSNYPRGVYLKPDTTEWRPARASVKATAQSIQYINAFNNFYPMEVIATGAETKALLAKHPGAPYLVFPEDRAYPIKMKEDLPYRWITRPAPGSVTLSAADKGESYAFQLGIYALKDLHHIELRFPDWKSATGASIPAEQTSCVNTQGVTYDGKPFHPVVDVPIGKIQPLWCTVVIPADAAPGLYKGTVTVKAEGLPDKEIPLEIKVGDKTAVEGGVNEPAKMTRLNWLNSTMAQANTVIAPYTPLVVEDTLVSLLGRNLSIGKDGLPAQIRTFFTPEMTSIGADAHELLTEAIHFHVNPVGAHASMKMTPLPLQFVTKEPGTVVWEGGSASSSLRMEVHASLEFDGFVAYTVKFIALEDLDLKDIRFHIPLHPEAAKYVIGLNRTGGYRPDSVQWKWDVAHKNQDGAWIGNVNEGLQFSLRDEHYVRPLNTNFYLLKPLVLPSSWGNQGKGGIDIAQKGAAILVDAYSGDRTLHKGDTLYYNFNLLITPFHPINTDFQWANRFYHKYNDDLDSVKAMGASVINIHHATPINPWLNYPFIEWKRMKGYIDTAHELGMKVKIYNTIRELSDHAYELPVLRSLGNEVYSSGKGGGFAWLQEHVADDYIPAWFVPEIKDAAIINSGMNRWHNYYVEGMNWLVQHVGIDGIYLDDVAFDRVTMKRIKRVLTADGHPGIIDLHSANQYDANDGFNNSANLYMEHFPYLNRLWFGEYFDYNKSPDFFLTEVSGIPFGLMGEMLWGGGNPWRGMVYGMTNRLGWTNVNDPRPLWKLWDIFGMTGSEMIGYWSGRCPVSTDQEKVLATVYKRKGRALVALGSWADGDVNAALRIDWNALGLDSSRAVIEAPEIEGFQPSRTFKPGDPIPVEKGKGWLLLISEK